MKLTIIIPVYNEEKTIGHILRRILTMKIPNIVIEAIVVDDGSTDTTTTAITKLKRDGSYKFIRHKKNMGKGAAVRTGIDNASGNYIIIQDADLEYDPEDIRRLIIPILGKITEVVYGTRLKRLPNLAKEEKTFRFLIHYFGNRFLSLLTTILYGQWITDMETGYKLFPKEATKNMNLHARGFEFEPEITAKLLKKGYKILEIPITTKPRGYGEGKKLDTIRDGMIALWTLFKYRIIE